MVQDSFFILKCERIRTKINIITKWAEMTDEGKPNFISKTFYIGQ